MTACQPTATTGSPNSYLERSRNLKPNLFLSLVRLCKQMAIDAVLGDLFESDALRGGQ